MEGTVINKFYMGLGAKDKALEVFQQLKTTCQQFNGNFTLLWHNNRLIDPDEKKLYEEIF